MLIEGADYFIRLVDFPNCKCNGAVMLNNDGTYSVYINARASEEQKRKALLHEITHVIRGDLHGNADICDVEDLV